MLARALTWDIGSGALKTLKPYALSGPAIFCRASEGHGKGCFFCAFDVVVVVEIHITTELIEAMMRLLEKKETGKLLG